MRGEKEKSEIDGDVYAGEKEKGEIDGDVYAGKDKRDLRDCGRERQSGRGESLPQTTKQVRKEEKNKNKQLEPRGRGKKERIKTNSLNQGEEGRKKE